MTIVDSKLVELLFDPNFGIMRCIAFASGSGTNFREAILESQEIGSNFSIDLLVTDKETKKGSTERIGALNYADNFKIESFFVNGFQCCGSWQEARKTAKGIREYHERCLYFNNLILDGVQSFEEGIKGNFDLAILAGYMRLFVGPLLRRFNNRAINIHPADLSVMNDDGFTRKYIGDNAVYDALVAGEKRTRSSIILVDSERDAGAILVSGPNVDYAGTRPVTQQLADAHQDRQKRESDWPALRFALKSIARGEIGLHKTKYHKDGNRVVVYRGEEMPYEGVVLT